MAQPSRVTRVRTRTITLSQACSSRWPGSNSLNPNPPSSTKRELAKVSLGANVFNELARHLHQSCVGLVIAHRLTQAGACDEVVVVGGGRFVESDRHEQFLASGSPYSRGPVSLPFAHAALSDKVGGGA